MLRASFLPGAGDAEQERAARLHWQRTHGVRLGDRRPFTADERAGRIERERAEVDRILDQSELDDEAIETPDVERHRHLDLRDWLDLAAVVLAGTDHGDRERKVGGN